MTSPRPRGPMRVLTTGGVRVISGLSDAEASVVGRHWNAVRDYLETGDDYDLSDFVNVFIRDSQLAASGRVVEWLAVRGQVSFESIYDEVI